MSADTAAVLAELAQASSLRIIDVMARTGLTRTQVHIALDQLRASGHVQVFGMGSRYSVRRPFISPPAVAPAHAAQAT